MERTWYQRLFSRPPAFDREALIAKAEGGDPDAQFGLGIQYGSGLGALRDPGQAAQWYRRAADQDHPLAQFNLGMMYADAGAQHQMGIRCQRATFVALQADVGEARIEAYKWFHLAAAQGYRGSELACEGMNLKMTRLQVAEGNRRAATFQPLTPRCEPPGQAG
jgi:hypothetical protein